MVLPKNYNSLSGGPWMWIPHTGQDLVQKTFQILRHNKSIQVSSRKDFYTPPMKFDFLISWKLWELCQILICKGIHSPWAFTVCWGYCGIFLRVLSAEIGINAFLSNYKNFQNLINIVTPAWSISSTGNVASESLAFYFSPYAALRRKELGKLCLGSCK